MPSGVDQSAVGGGIQVQGNASATVRSTTITRNSVSSKNTVGDALGFSGGFHADGPIVLRDSTVSDNSVAATAASGRAEGDSGAGEINTDATISNTLFAGNSVTATSSAGVAHAAADAVITAAADQMTISDSVISANRVTATTTTGSSTVHGGGIANIGVVTLRNTHVGDNTGSASGPSGDARGGGIWNGSAPTARPRCDSRSSTAPSRITP